MTKQDKLDNLLELAYEQVRDKIYDFSPGDLNALIKTIHTIKREEVEDAPKTTPTSSTVGSFIAKHATLK